MAKNPLRKLVRPLPEGQITIPAAMRRALGITESSLLDVAAEGDKIIISKVSLPQEGDFRLYSDEEIAQFLEEDKITPQTAQRVRDLMRAGLV